MTLSTAALAHAAAQPPRPGFPAPGDWPEQAACSGADPELFYHPYAEREPSRSRRDRAAKAVCSACPVRRACRDHARTRAEPYGVWGGESETERAEWLAARHAPVPLGAPAVRLDPAATRLPA